MIILYDNKVLNSTITMSTENPDYTFDVGLKDTRLSRYGMTDGNAFQNIVFDLGASFSVTYAVIQAHNITGTVILQSSLSTDFTTPEFQQVFTKYGDSLVCEIPARSRRYWRLAIFDPLNSAGGIKVGQVYIGSGLQMPGIDRMIILPQKSNSVAQKSTSGQLYGDRRLNYKAADINFSDVTETERQQIKTFFSVVDVVQPFTLLIWEDALNIEEPIYCSLTKDLEWKRQDVQGNLWTLNLSFEQCF